VLNYPHSFAYTGNQLEKLTYTHTLSFTCLHRQISWKRLHIHTPSHSLAYTGKSVGNAYIYTHPLTHLPTQAEQLVRALQALYNSGVSRLQPYDDLVSALLKAPRSTGTTSHSAIPPPHIPDASTSRPAWQGRHPAGTAAAGSSTGADALSSMDDSAGAQESLRPPPPSTWPAPSSAAVDLREDGGREGGSRASAAGGWVRGKMAEGTDAPGLNLWQLQAVYSVLRALDHPQAAIFSQVCALCLFLVMCARNSTSGVGVSSELFLSTSTIATYEMKTGILYLVILVLFRELFQDFPGFYLLVFSLLIHPVHFLHFCRSFCSRAHRRKQRRRTIGPAFSSSFFFSFLHPVKISYN
jgi:hypothetical protein